MKGDVDVTSVDSVDDGADISDEQRVEAGTVEPVAADEAPAGARAEADKPADADVVQDETESEKR